MTGPVTGSVTGQASQQIPVRFLGARSRTGPISVGQENMRRVVAGNDPEHINACLIWAVPAGASLERVAAAVRALLLRHESLRTTYPAGQDTQVVHATGEVPVAVYPAPRDPAGYAEMVGLRMRAQRFDPATELPIRVAVVTADGDPVHLVAVLCHVAIDAAGLDLLCREWTDLVAGRVLPAPAALQPVDVAELEHAPAGRRRIANSLRYWETLLRQAPQATFVAAGVGATDWMLPRLRIRSRAAAVALAGASERTGAGPATIVLAAMCALVGYRFAQRTGVVSMLAANRFMPEMRDYVGTVAQDAAMSVDLDTTSFDEMIRRVRSRSLAANRHSWFDSAVLWRLMDDVGAQRGTHWGRDCVFNDLTALTLRGLLNVTAAGAARELAGTGGSDGSEGTAGAEGTDGTGDAGAPDARLAWLPAEVMPTRLMLWAMRLDGEVELSLWADPQGLPRPDAENFGRGIVALLVESGERDADLGRLGELTGLRPVARGPGWYLIDSCWIELAAVQRLLAEVLPDHHSLVVARPDPRLGHRLECYVAARTGPMDATLTPERIHAACVAGLGGRQRPTALAPHRYFICERAPDDPGDPDAWCSAHALAAGSGRESPPAAGAGAR